MSISSKNDDGDDDDEKLYQVASLNHLLCSPKLCDEETDIVVQNDRKSFWVTLKCPCITGQEQLRASLVRRLVNRKCEQL